MKKIELIVESVYVNRLLELFKKHDINGYSIIKDIQGCGGHGLKMADDVSDVFSNNYIFVVCEETVYQDIRADLLSFLKKYGGKCILSQAEFLCADTDA